jgi:membrane protein DedA with SNARE-associated domain
MDLLSYISPDHLRMLSPLSVYLTLGTVLLLCGLSLPIPEDVSLITAGYLAHLKVVDIHVVFAVCFVAVIGGDTIAFMLGRMFGTRLLNSRLAKRFFKPRKQIRVRAYFRRYGSKVIFVARFLPGLRFSVFLSAGTLRLPPSVFFIYDSLAAALSVPALVYLAYFFGDRFDQVIKWARTSEYGIVGIVVVALVVVAIKVLRKRKRKQQPASAPTNA